MSSVHLKVDQVQDARHLAQRTYERYQSVRGHYTNSLDSHFKGKLGEIALEQFLAANSDEKFDSLFRDPNFEYECDIKFQGFRIEVKTWTRRFWDEFGRCVAVAQYEKLRQKADLVVWCISETPTDYGCEVEIFGWNEIEEIPTAVRHLTGKSDWRQVENYQFRPDQIHDIATLPMNFSHKESSPGSKKISESESADANNLNIVLNRIDSKAIAIQGSSIAKGIRAGRIEYVSPGTLDVFVAEAPNKETKIGWISGDDEIFELLMFAFKKRGIGIWIPFIHGKQTTYARVPSRLTSNGLGNFLISIDELLTTELDLKTVAASLSKLFATHFPRSDSDEARQVFEIDAWQSRDYSDSLTSELRDLGKGGEVLLYVKDEFGNFYWND